MFYAMDLLIHIFKKRYCWIVLKEILHCMYYIGSELFAPSDNMPKELKEGNAGDYWLFWNLK